MATKPITTKHSATPTTRPELEVLRFASAKAYSSWLAKHHAKSPGIRIAIAKKAAGIASITYDEAVEVSLCWGWIDGRRNALDEREFLQHFSPRRARSPWSKINRGRVQALIDAGRMQPPGLAEIERAKNDGRWDAAYDSPRTMEVPADLTAALAEQRKAEAEFAALDSRNRYAILFRIHHAKKPETRAKRIAELVAMLARGERLHS